MKKVCTLFLFVFVLLANCGLPEEYFLPPVPKTIRVSTVYTADIPLPNIDSTLYPHFTNFKIFYRIYISDQSTDQQIVEDDTALMGQINSTLRNNVNSINTDHTDTSITSNTVSNYFTNNRFCELQLEGQNIDTLLRTAGTVTIAFPSSNELPNMEKGGSQYNLIRPEKYINGNTFRPETDDLYFFNTDELNDNSFATTTQNGDVAPNTSATGTPRYTYVLMYIVTSGFNPTNLTTIYSIPTFIGIFRLPEK